MSNTFYIQGTEQLSDSNNATIASNNFNFNQSYSEASCGTVVISALTTLSVGTITSPYVLKLDSDDTGMVCTLGTLTFPFNHVIITSGTALSTTIKVNGTGTVKYEIYGD
jgi:hypothetical protein